MRSPSVPLQPYAPQAATLCISSSPPHRRLQPDVSQAATLCIPGTVLAIAAPQRSAVSHTGLESRLADPRQACCPHVRAAPGTGCNPTQPRLQPYVSQAPLGQVAPPEGPELRWTAAAPVESGPPPAPRAATEGVAEPSPSLSPSPRRASPVPPQPAAESTYNLGRQPTPVATLPYLDARFASLPLALAPLLIPLWLLGSSAYFQPRQARRARPGAGQPRAAWWRRGWAWLLRRASRFGFGS